MKSTNRDPLTRAKTLLELPSEAFCYYDRNMTYGMHDGDYTVSVRTSCTDICAEFEAQVRNQKVMI